jgi:nitronate monooxygenase
MESLFDRLLKEGLGRPIIQAPMAGGATTPELVAAVSRAGVLGFLAGAALPASDIVKQGAAIRALSDKPFGVNLFVLPDEVTPSISVVEGGWRALNEARKSFGLESALPPIKFCERFSDQFEALLEVKPLVASFTFGILSHSEMDRLKSAGVYVIGTATHVAEALAWEALGADAICAQGFEAGGHRGTFLSPASSLVKPNMPDAQTQQLAATGLFVLVPSIVDAVQIPVIAAGGVMDGRGVAAALALGARAVQMGTAFLTTEQSSISSTWKAALMSAQSNETTLTRAFSGRYARGLRNQFIADFEQSEHLVPDYPVQNALTAEIRKRAATIGDPQHLSLWAGQGVSALKSRGLGVSATELVLSFVAEYEQVVKDLPRSIT